MGRKAIDNIRKPQILDACREVFSREGFENTTLVKIARHMGVSKGLVLHYYNSKEELFRDMLDDLFFSQPTLRKDIENLPKDLSPRERLEKIFELYYSEEYSEYFNDVIFYGAHYIALRDQELLLKMKSVYSQLVEEVTSEIRLYLKATGGDLSKAKKASILFGSLLEGFDFLYTLMRSDLSFSEYREFLIEQVWHYLDS